MARLDISPYGLLLNKTLVLRHLSAIGVELVEWLLSFRFAVEIVLEVFIMRRHLSVLYTLYDPSTVGSLKNFRSYSLGGEPVSLIRRGGGCFGGVHFDHNDNRCRLCLAFFPSDADSKNQIKFGFSILYSKYGLRVLG